MYDHKQVRAFIIQPSLQAITLYSKEAEETLIAIMAHESLGGKYLRQVSNNKPGVARGPYEMEPATHNDIIAYVDKEYPDVMTKFSSFCPYAKTPISDFMINDLFYSTIMARLFWLRIKEPFPEVSDINGIAAFWKKYWNTEKGSGKVYDFIKNYHNFIKGI